MNGFGFSVGIVTLFIIGLGFIWVIRGERYLGYLWWPYTMGVGILSVVSSLFVSSNLGFCPAGHNWCIVALGFDRT